MPSAQGQAGRCRRDGRLCQWLKLGTAKSPERRERHGPTKGAPVPTLQYAGFGDGTKMFEPLHSHLCVGCL